MKRFLFLFLSFTVPGAQFWFWPQLCIVPPSGICSTPRWEGANAGADWGTLTQAREGYRDHIWDVCKVLYPAFHTFHCVLLWSFNVPSCLQCFWSRVYSFRTSLLAVEFASDKIFDSSLHCLVLCYHDYGRKCLWAWLQVSWEKLWYNIRTYFSSYLKKIQVLLFTIFSSYRMSLLQTASNLNNEIFAAAVFQELGVSYVSVYILFIYFSCFIVLVTTSRTNFKKSGERGYPWITSKCEGKPFYISVVY